MKQRQEVKEEQVEGREDWEGKDGERLALPS